MLEIGWALPPAAAAAVDAAIPLPVVAAVAVRVVAPQILAQTLNPRQCGAPQGLRGSVA